MMKRVTITSTRYHTRYHMRYDTFSLSLTWIGHNAKRYHNFNLLLHALPYIFSKFSMVWGYWQCVTTRYHQIYKKIYINIFLKKMTVTRGNALQIAQNQENFRKKYTVTRVVTHVVTRSSYGNTLH